VAAGPFGAMTSQAAADGMLTMEKPQLALAAPASLCAGERDAIQILRRLVLRAKPTSI
jgi:hypothetical protein